MLAIAAAIYEHPFTQSLGPELSALCAGFAVLVLGKLHLTPLGELYLQSKGD
jgi:hypothetical protein